VVAEDGTTWLAIINVIEEYTRRFECLGKGRLYLIFVGDYGGLSGFRGLYYQLFKDISSKRQNKIPYCPNLGFQRNRPAFTRN